MCDQTELSYGDGDVVWVKMGPIWWPGVVRDVSKEGKEEEVLGGLKNKPISTVQFFDEEKYEFVKNLEHIYHYNCRRKDEFIKKGLDKFRTGAKHMKKFPEDVGKAEELIKGDVNIVNDPKFAPQEKKNFNDLFGTPKKKIRKTEDLAMKTKFLPLKKRLSAPVHRQMSATHTPSTSSSNEFSCPLCDFSANLIPTMSSHFLYFHSSQRANFGGSETDSVPIPRRYAEPKRSRPMPGSSKKKGRPPKPKEEPPSSATKESSPKGTPVKRATETPVVADKTSEKKKRFTDALLADWSEDEDNKEDGANNTDLNENINVLEPVEGEKLTAEVPSTLPEAATEKEADVECDRNLSGSAECTNDNDKRETSSCFDFDDEDDGFIGMSDAFTYGRKIPRVIPVKDKTDLGRDMEVDEVFKKKADSESMDDDEIDEKEVIPIKKRGRPPKVAPANELAKTPKINVVKKVAKPMEILKEGLAATRSRRPGARKSYLNEVIEKMDDDGTDHVVQQQDSEERETQQEVEREKLVKLPSRKPVLIVVKKSTDAIDNIEEKNTVEEFELEEPEAEELDESEQEVPAKSSRRKQDLKSQKLLEYDDVESLVLAQKKQADFKKKILKEMEEKLAKGKEEKKAEAITASLDAGIEIAPTSCQAIVSQKPDDTDDDLTAQVESLLEETKVPTVFPKASSFSVLGKREEISEDIEYLEDDPPIITTPVKQTVPASPAKKIKTLELEQSIKKSAIPQWRQGIQESLKLNKELKEGSKMAEPAKTNIIKLSTHRLVQPQQKTARYLILSPQQISNSPSTTQRIKLSNLPRTVTPSSVGNIDPSRKKVIKLSGNTVQQNQIIKNFNGTGKMAVILNNVAGGSLARKIMVTPEKKCYIQRKGPDGNITLKSIGGPKQQIVYANQTQRLKVVSRPEAVVEPIAEPVVPEPPARVLTPQQVILPPTGDVQTTYMLVTVDGQTVLQAVDTSLLPYNIQPEVSTQLYEAPTEQIKPTYSSPGQDILAEALANTNVLESEMPLMMPSVVQETCVTMQKPIMSPMEVPSHTIPDASLIIAPIVQETSITLQKPIMTPLEVPTSIIADTSGLEPPPLPPTPTEEDVMMEEPEDSLMIAEQPAPASVTDDPHHQGHFFIDDSQEAAEEVNSFQSMPLLNEESIASEEHIGDQNFDAQQGTHIENNEYLPTSTNPDLEPEQSVPAEEEVPLNVFHGAETQEEMGKEKDVQSLPFITEEGFVVSGDAHSSQETEVTSTTGDSKDIVV